MSSRPELKLDWCGHDAAKYAVEHWHYSECLPAGKLLKVGVWEAGLFIGAVIFSRGANNNLGRPFSLAQVEIAELTRIALTKHCAPVTRIVSIAFQFLRKNSPGLRLIVSYADPLKGHHGGIYQGGGMDLLRCITTPARSNARWGCDAQADSERIVWNHKRHDEISHHVETQIPHAA